MASARKTFARRPTHAGLPRTEAVEAACFMADLLDGTVRATALHEIRAGNGQLIRLEYDDPTGPAARKIR